MATASQPSETSLDRQSSALLVVDMQNDFGSEGGMFHRAGIDISPIQAAVAPTARVLTAARNAGVKVIYLKMGFRPDLSDLGTADSPNRARHLLFGVGQPVQTSEAGEGHCLIRDTWNTEILPQLSPHTEDVVIYKHRFSGFYQTELDDILQRQGVKYLIVTGCTTSVCVESTIRDAMFRDYCCLLLEDCTAEPIGNDLPRSNHAASLLTIQTLLGWVSTSQKFIRAIEQPVTASATVA